jgi:hypothetical protein
VTGSIDRGAYRLRPGLLVVTENRVENLSGFVPIEMAAIETLMAQKGLNDYRLK